ncbi:MAG: NUDIX domain-containing protein [Candidatus Aenigmarchaeota archaeon]|nr:NUDIX domain-containing protein [Candidatus Aenigmarchaeota archaeon]
MEEYFDVVDENDNVIGKASRKECHSNPKLIHRGVFVLILNSKGQLLLQKRSMKKDLSPGKWTCSASGHNDMGESYEDAAMRETREELGIETGLEFMFLVKFRHETESENDRIFIGVHDGPFHPNRDELDEVKFFDMEEVRKMVEEKKSVTPGSVLVLENYLKSIKGKAK